MKSLLALLFPLFVFPQSKGDNVILVKGVSFYEAVTRLLDEGYSIEKIDSNFKTVQTAFKQTKKPSTRVSIFIRVKDSTAIVTGIVYDMVLVGIEFLGRRYTEDDAKDPIANIGMKGSSAKDAFIEMDRFAKSFNKTIEYKKE